MNYQQITFIIEAQHAEACAEWLEENEALSVTFSEAENEPLFQIEVNEAPLWKQTKISAFYDAEDNIENIIAELKNSFSSLYNFTHEFVEDQDWVRLTQRNFPTQCYADNLWIVPSWEKPEPHFHNVVRIDPGLAFGTGSHATTFMCLDYLADHAPKDLEMVDFGCGSGILALAALALGAKKVYAIDHDPQALLATENNAQLNEFCNSENLVACQLAQMPKTKFPFIIANVLAQPLISLAPQIMDLLEDQGTLVLSGLLEHEQDELFSAYAKRCHLRKAIQKDGWALLELQAI